MKKYKELLEEIQVLDELSKQTLGSYVKKASSDAITHGIVGATKSTKGTFEKNKPEAGGDDYRKSFKREAGIRKAVDKMTCEGIEEVELNEEKIPVQHVTDSVAKVLGTKSASRFLTHLKPGIEKHTTWHKVNNALLDQGVKTHHIASIASHVKPAQFKEEVEELDELSKKTLGSYVNKASAQQYTTGINRGAYHQDPKTKPFSDAAADQASKRQKGIAKAVSKLTKESVELDEVLKGADAGEYVKDFQDSDAPQFKGKSKEKRHQMAIAAYLEAKRKNK